MMVKCNNFTQVIFSENNMGKSPYHLHKFRTEVQERKELRQEVYWLMGAYEIRNITMPRGVQVFNVGSDNNLVSMACTLSRA